jgi:two-component system phosphate regulon sensor histidine kinase PhoR
MRDVSLAIRSGDDLIALASRLRLEQILINLLDNAIKFNRPAGAVAVNCDLTPDKRMVAITVSDTGIGIPSDAVNRVFERFYRVDRARSREAGGTGLGLSIVKESVEEMGGSITVESQLGHGTRFTILIPSALADVPVPARLAES